MADTLLTGTTLIEDKRSEKGGVLSIPFTSFVTSDYTDDATYVADSSGHLVLTGAGIQVLASVSLPHGAVITSCVVYANVATETWTLYRNPVAVTASAQVLATANLGTADTSISFETVNNSDFRYHIVTQGMDATDRIYGAVITYD